MGIKKKQSLRFSLHIPLIIILMLIGTMLLAACSVDEDTLDETFPGNDASPGEPLDGGMMDEGTLPDDDQAPMEEPLSEPQGGEGVGQEDQALPGEADLRNGERIYFTATNTSGERITYQGGPDFGGMMMGDYLSCAVCHGPEAQGGQHVMHMEVMDAPAITYAALSGEGEDHAREEDDHADEHGTYDLETFRMAVVEGKHPDGEKLDENMPRWNIQDDDLRDLFAFLKALSPPDEGE